MVCATITRDPNQIDDRVAIRIRDALHTAIVAVMHVNPNDVELRVREKGRLDKNAQPLVIEIDTGAGQKNERIKRCRELHALINEQVTFAVPPRFRSKEKSNMWLRVFAKGASAPIGVPGMQH